VTLGAIDPRLGIGIAHRGAVLRWRIELAGHQPTIGLDHAGTGGDQVDQRAGLAQHLEHLSRGRRQQQVEASRNALALEQAGRGQHVAQGDARVAAEHDLRHRLARQLARGSDAARLIHDERIHRREVDGEHLLAWRSGIGDERAMGLASPLVAQEYLGLVVADE
jgi:hypothetical protein